MVCFLDMDGVLADFVTAACLAHGRRSPYINPANLGKFDLEKLWGISLDEFWKPIDNEGFWYEIPPMHDAERYVQIAEENFDEVVILTDPGESIYSFLGKKDWLSRHFPRYKNRIIFASASAKKLMAAPGRFLIDDRDENVKQFNERGGIGILVPRPWNAGHAYGIISYSHVRFRIRESLSTSKGTVPRGEGSGPLPDNKWICSQCRQDYWTCPCADPVAVKSTVLESQGYEPVANVGGVAPGPEAGSTDGQASGTPFTFDSTNEPGKSGWGSK
jgi:5'(3')-deoxyribonucleotidase